MDIDGLITKATNAIIEEYDINNDSGISLVDIEIPSGSLLLTTKEFGENGKWYVDYARTVADTLDEYNTDYGDRDVFVSEVKNALAGADENEDDLLTSKEISSALETVITAEAVTPETAYGADLLTPYGSPNGLTRNDMQNYITDNFSFTDDEAKTIALNIYNRPGPHSAETLMGFIDLDNRDTISERNLEYFLTHKNTFEEIDINNIHQGGDEQLGDCWFLSGMMTLAGTEEGRTAIDRAINKNDDGSYSVTFPGDVESTYVITQDDLSGASVGGDEIMQVFELAAIKYHADHTDEFRDDDFAGDTPTAVGNMFNMHINYIYDETAMYDDTTDDETIRTGGHDAGEIKASLIDYANNHDVISLSVATDWYKGEDSSGERISRPAKVGEGISGGHAITITDIDVDNNTVTYLNPHDTSPEKAVTVSLDDFSEYGIKQMTSFTDTKDFSAAEMEPVL